MDAMKERLENALSQTRQVHRAVEELLNQLDDMKRILDDGGNHPAQNLGR